jgi:phosphotransferase system HPr (HPr) family protein
MLSRTVAITCPSGLHARPLARLIALCRAFSSEISFVTPKGEFSCRSIVALLGSGMKQGTVVEIKVDGPDEAEALPRIVGLLEALGNEPGQDAPKPEAEAAGKAKTYAAGEPKTYVAGEPKTYVAGEPKTYAAGEPKTYAAGEPKTYAAGEPKTYAAGEPKAYAAGEPKTYAAGATRPGTPGICPAGHAAPTEAG